MNTLIAKRIVAKFNDIDYPNWETGLLQFFQIHKEQTPCILTQMVDLLHEVQTSFFYRFLANLLDTTDCGLSKQEKRDWISQFIAYECEAGIFYTGQLPHYYHRIESSEKKELTLLVLHETYLAVLCDLQSDPTHSLFKKRMSRLLRHIASAIIVIQPNDALKKLKQIIAIESDWLLDRSVFGRYFEPVLTYFERAFYQKMNQFPYG